MMESLRGRAHAHSGRQDAARCTPLGAQPTGSRVRLGEAARTIPGEARNQR